MACSSSSLALDGSGPVMRASVLRERLVFRFSRAEPACIGATTSGSKLGSLPDVPAWLIWIALPDAPSRKRPPSCPTGAAFASDVEAVCRFVEQRADQRTNGLHVIGAQPDSGGPLDRRGMSAGSSLPAAANGKRREGHGGAGVFGREDSADPGLCAAPARRCETSSSGTRGGVTGSSEVVHGVWHDPGPIGGPARLRL